MNCRLATQLVSARMDGELSFLGNLRLQHHLRGCAPCAARLQAMQQMRADLRRGALRYAAPPRLRDRVLALAAGDAPPAAGHRREPPRWQWLAAGAMAGSAATVLVILAGNLVLGGVRGDSLAAEAVKDHVQASLNERQIEIASSDQHTVKPWLSARLDYSPPVRDLADEGFALAGGRLDTLAGQRVATLVYRYRLHTIDVFVRPQPAAAPAGPHSLRGFNVAHASASGMDYLAVSDVSAEVLGQFVQRLAAQAAGP